MRDDELRHRVGAIRWFHSIELRPGLTTPGLDDTSARVDILKLPARLDGLEVLDVGAWDGFFSFEAERRGAQRVVAADAFAWNGANWSTKEGFELAREALGSRVEDVDVDVMKLDPVELGTFDLVLCLGVLYHLRDPLGGLERVASVTRDRLVLETHVDCTYTRRPTAALYPSHELRDDPTNWWGPNPEAVAGMLRAVGFSHVEVVSRDSALYRAARMARRVVRRQPPWQGRVVVHARK